MSRLTRECSHEPDWATVRLAPGTTDTIDVNCKHCGQSASFVDPQLNWDTEPRDFGEAVKDLIDQGLEDHEILERLDPDTAGTDLVALVRNLLQVQELEITNRAPDTDTITVKSGGCNVAVSRDEAGATWVCVSDPNGNLYSMVLGVEGYTQKL
jgi:hypothetical protein